MTNRIKNWKLLLLALIFISLFTYLGFWQLSRGQEKKLLLQTFSERTAHEPYTSTDLRQLNDWRFYRLTLTGEFDNAHSILLDNKTIAGKVGYEVYTPFKAHGMPVTMLIDRGFIPMGESRRVLPIIKPIVGQVTITGMINVPPTYVAFGKIAESKSIDWPLRVEYINLPELSNLLNDRLYPYLIVITPNDPAAYQVTWQIVIMPPERHFGYAVQWFALALTLLILSAILNYRHKKL